MERDRIQAPPPTAKPTPGRPPLPPLDVENLQAYLSRVAQDCRDGSVSIDVTDRLISCARALILATTARDEPHTAQP